MAEANTREDELEVIPKAVIVVAANLAPMIWFLFGTTDIVSAEPTRGIWFSAEGPTFVTAVLYLFVGAASIGMAAIALVGLLGPRRMPVQALRASSALLGVATLLLGLHVVVAAATADRTYHIESLVSIVALAIIPTVIGFAAWRLARHATPRA